MKKNILVGVLLIIILGLGLVVGIFLVGQQQIFKQKAAPNATANVSISPSTGTFAINSVNPISVTFNTAGALVTGINVRITFSNLSAKGSGLLIDQNFLGSGNWTCPTKNITDTGSTEEIDISCANTSSGFSTSTDTTLATFNLTPNSVPAVNPLILSLDPQNTTMTQSNNTNLTISTSSTGSYTITSSLLTSPTPTPPLVIPSPTATVNATINPMATSTPSATPTASTFGVVFPTATPTMRPIPVTGFDAPTIIGVAVGLILVAASLVLLI